jgi:dCTP deaminase
MTRGRSRGTCLALQTLRSLVLASQIITAPGDPLQNERNKTLIDGRLAAHLEEKLKPASYEPGNAGEAYILNTQPELFRVGDEQVYRRLLELPSKQRQRVDIHGGFELKRGHTYLLPIVERVQLPRGRHMKSSPKSSCGRLFINTRQLTDYNDGHNEAHWWCRPGAELMSWLLVQPRQFDIIIDEHTTLTQQRFFDGLDAQLSDRELIATHKRTPLMYEKTDGTARYPADVRIWQGLRVSIDVDGALTNGVIGFRARDNPQPIDMTDKSKEGTYRIDEYFDPLLAREKPCIEPHTKYLFNSNHLLHIPPHLSGELLMYSELGFEGSTHRAGFLDNDFLGDLVYEIESSEDVSLQLLHDMVCSTIWFFQTDETPERLYGPASGAHYQGQIGPRIAKYFEQPDFGYFAKEYKNAMREVMTLDRLAAISTRKKESGFELL